MPLRVITRRARFWSALVLIAAFSLWNAYWTIQKKKRNSEQFLGIISCGTNTVTEKQDLSNSSTTMVRWAADLNNALDPGRLRALALQLRSNYSAAYPFPHTVVDGLFPPSIIAAVESENPESIVAGDGCLPGVKCFEEKNTQFRKSAIDDESKMGPATKLMFNTMKSSTFVSFLEELSGIPNIIPDPHYRGSGLHFIGPGGLLGIHADFNRYQKFGLHRRVNCFIFLNHDWKKEYGGHLELWDRSMKSCGQRILPGYGRFVVFSSTDFSYHGHPHPLNCPIGRARRSLALYFYTQDRPAHECVDGDCDNQHTTLFQKPLACSGCLDQSCSRLPRANK